MPNTIIIRKIKSELSKLELENFISRDFHPNIDGTFKNNFLTNKVDFTYASINSQEICIQMSIDNYNEILFNDYLLGYERIIKQIE